MQGRCRVMARWARAALLVVCLDPASGRAGEWHRGSGLTCSDCHTMHNSLRGQSMRYDADPTPAEKLLRADGTTAVCIACHGGDRPTALAPDVKYPSALEPPGGGFPADLGDPAQVAHALAPTPAVPPQGSLAMVLTCGTCHDSHGNGNYRNLRDSPAASGRFAPAPIVHQAVTANGTNPADVYTGANVRYVSGMSQWCIDCHDLITSAHVAAGGSTLLSHPWDRTIAGGAATGVTDLAAWMATVPNRVPVQNRLGLAPPNDADEVFCLSCHRAHGSPNPAGLVYADGVTLSSTCQQCHNQ